MHPHATRYIGRNRLARVARGVDQAPHTDNVDRASTWLELLVVGRVSDIKAEPGENPAYLVQGTDSRVLVEVGASKLWATFARPSESSSAGLYRAGDHRC